MRGWYLFCVFGHVYVWTLGFDIPFFGMLYHSWFVWSIGHSGHCFEAQPPKPYFVLAQNIKLVHSFITGRMNLPVPIVYGTTFGKTILFWNIWWRLTSLHLYLTCFICGMVSYFTPLMPSRTTY